jgi:hypothetical protein
LSYAFIEYSIRVSEGEKKDNFLFYYRLGVNIRDEHGRTPVHSAFRLSNNSNSNKSAPEKLFDVDIDFGSKVIDTLFSKNK